NIGSGIQPFNAWLLIRGLRTLPARLERINQSTKKVFDYLVKHPKVEEVIFPFNPSFPQYELAKRQMKAAFGLMTLVIRTTNMESIVRFCESLKHIMMAVSWGGHESLVIPKCAGLKPVEFDIKNKEHRYVRLYVGLEEPDYLVADLEQALATVD
ncbi:MAG: PLP-dependent transferase, partial [Bacteroidetes bacterium]|nr:PLP-dependent transferase [Bacteroidota bacterium]